MTTLSIILLILLFLPFAYLLVMALASVRPAGVPDWKDRPAATRFAIAIPAHNEDTVIASTVQRLWR